MAGRTKRTEVPDPVAQVGKVSAALDELTGALPRLVEISIDELYPHPSNPRRDLGDLTEIADSIRTVGIRQPLTVVPVYNVPDFAGETRQDTDGMPYGYVTVIGHRRAAAAALAGRTTVPAIIDDALTPAQQLELMLVENVQRADLSPVEEADGYQGLLDLGLDVDAIARETGRSESTVRRRLKLVALPEKAREKLHRGQATLEQAARLEEFEDDPTLVEQLAKVLGSKDFENELAKAVEKRTIQVTLEHLVTQLEAAGVTKIDNPANDGYAGVTPDGMLRADSLGRWELKNGLSHRGVQRFVEQSAAAGSGWVFRVYHSTWDDNLYLFRPLADEETARPGSSRPAADPEWERQRAEREAAYAALVARHERFTGLRAEFVAGLKVRTLTAKQTAALTAFVARRELRTLWTEDGHYPDRDELLKWLGIEPFGNDTSADEDDAVVYAAIDALDTGHQLLAFAVLVEEDQLGVSGYAESSTGAYYGLLEDLGYGVSSEEAEAINPPVTEQFVAIVDVNQDGDDEGDSDEGEDD